MKKINKLFLLLLVLSVLFFFVFSIFLNSNYLAETYNDSSIAKGERTDFKKENYGGFGYYQGYPTKMKIEVKRLKRDIYLVKYDLFLQQGSVNFGGVGIYYYLNDEVIHKEEQAGQFSSGDPYDTEIHKSYEKEIKIQDTKPNTFKIKYKANYGNYHPEDEYTLEADPYDDEDPNFSIENKNVKQKVNFYNLIDNRKLNKLKIINKKTSKIVDTYNFNSKTYSNVSFDLPEGKYMAVLYDDSGNKKEIDNILVDKTDPIIEIRNSLNNNIVTDGSRINFPVKFLLTDNNISNDEINNYVKFYIKEGNSFIEYQRNNQNGLLYFNALNLKNNDITKFDNKYKYGPSDKVFYINGNLYKNRKLLLNEMFDYVKNTSNNLFTEKLYSSDMNVEFISERQANLAQIGKKIFIYKHIYYNSQESIKNDKVIFSEKIYASCEEDEMDVKIKELLSQNILSISFNAFFIDDNQEKTFKIEIIDKAGNKVEKTFTIDRILPQVIYKAYKDNAESSFISYKGSLYTNDEVRITLENNIKAYRVENDKLNEVQITNNLIKLDQTGNYTFKFFDEANNEKTISFIIDKDKPKLFYLNAYYDKERNIYFTNSFSDITVKDNNYIIKAEYRFQNENEEINYDCKKEETIKFSKDNKKDISNTKVEVTFTDLVGNKSTFIIVLDRIKPNSIKINDNKIYINHLNDITVSDSSSFSSYIKSIKIINLKFESNNSLVENTKENKEVFQLDDINLEDIKITDFSSFIKQENQDGFNGIYKIIVEDYAGNKEEKTFTIFKNDKEYYENENLIKNEFKQIVTYRVNLPAYLFEKINGIYSFKTEEDAKTFAFNSEFHERVLKRDDGYMYISKANPSVAELYKDKEKLDDAIKYYAYKYVQERIIYQNGTNNYYKILNNHFEEDNAYLDDENISNLKEYRVYRIKKTFKFKENKNILNVPTKIYLAYYNAALDKFEEPFEISINKTLEDQIEKTNKLQGYYAVYEEDEANENFNKINYVVYYDAGKPFLNATINEKENQEFNDLYIKENTNKENKNTFKYISFKINLFNDNEDNNRVVMILNGAGYNNQVFTQEDIEKLPVFSFATGHFGNLNIKVYDRNFNVLNLNVQIAGEEPKWFHSDETDTKDNLTMRFRVYDQDSIITDIKIYKYEIDLDNIENQRKVLLETDSKNNKIEAKRLFYEFSEGGKYQVEFKDNYGRVFIENPIFYMKGLPYLRLENVSNNKITNKDVRIIFSTNYQLYIYKTSKNGQKTIIPSVDYEERNDFINNLDTITIKSYEGITDAKYDLLLIDKSNRALYSEYSFQVDAVLADIEVVDKDGNRLKENIATNKPFKIIYYEDGMYLTTKKAGSIDYYYKKGDLIESDGEYTFTIRDRVGNQKTFKMILDKRVSYNLKGNYIIDKDRIISNSKVRIELLENIDSITGNVEKINDGVYEVNHEGLNKIIIKDKRENTKILNILIDKTAPKYKLINVELNGTTNKDVKIEIEEGNKITINFNSKKIENNKLINTLTEDGTYQFIITDIAGNKSIGTFKIDKTVNFYSNLKLENAITTDDILVSLKEDGSIKAFLDNKEIKQQDTYSKDGVYKFILKDSNDNEIILNYIKVKTLSTGYDLKLFKNQEIVFSELNNEPINKNDLLLNRSGNYLFKIKDTKENKIYRLALSVDNEKPTIEIKNQKGVYEFSHPNKKDLTYKLFKDGKEIKFQNQISKSGNYKLVIKDKLGNENTYNFKIKYKISTASIIFISVIIILIISAIIFMIHKRRKMKVA